MKKYKTIFDEKRKLYRIEALRNFGDVKKGQLGGFIAKEENLSHEGDCWVYKDALVFEDAHVSENAKIYDQVKVYDNACIYGEAQIHDTSQISVNANVYGNASVWGDSWIHDDAKVYDNAHIFSSSVGGSAQVFENAVVHYGPSIKEHAQIKGKAIVCGLAEIFGDAIVAKNGDYLVLHKWWSDQHQYITWTRSNDKYKDGSFYGTAEEFLDYRKKYSMMFASNYEQIVKYVNEIARKVES